MNESESNFCSHCGAAIVADSARPYYHSQSRIAPIEPRWATLNGAAVYSGLSRSLLWEMAKEGSIRTASVRRGEGMKRGRRLVDLRSLDAWIERWVSEI